MGFCTTSEYLGALAVTPSPQSVCPSVRPRACARVLSEFLRAVPEFERMIVASGVVLLKLWFSVSQDEQVRGAVVRAVVRALTQPASRRPADSLRGPLPTLACRCRAAADRSPCAGSLTR
jgi:hypothetical protein